MTNVLKMMVNECAVYINQTNQSITLLQQKVKVKYFHATNDLINDCKKQSVARIMFLEKPMDNDVREEFYR